MKMKNFNEMQLIMTYRTLNHEKQEEILGFCEFVAYQCKKQKVALPKGKIKPIHCNQSGAGNSVQS